jgi:hypothetical protein
MANVVGLEWSPDSTPAQRWCVGIVVLVILELFAALGGWPFVVALAALALRTVMLWGFVAVVRQDDSHGSPE